MDRARLERARDALPPSPEPALLTPPEPPLPLLELVLLEPALLSLPPPAPALLPAPEPAPPPLLEPAPLPLPALEPAPPPLLEPAPPPLPPAPLLLAPALYAVPDPVPAGAKPGDCDPTVVGDRDSPLATPTQTEVAIWETSNTGPQGGAFTLGGSPAQASSHLSGFAPRVVSLVLGIVIAVELARASMLVLGANPSKAPEAPPVRSAQTSPPPAIDVHGIVAAHLFGRTEGKPGTQDSGKAPQTTADLLLAGTLAMEDPNRGLAIISIDGRSTAYRVGDSVADGALDSVYRDHVLLRRRGILETLVFPKVQQAGKSSGPRAAAALAARTATRTDEATEPRPAQLSAAAVVRGMPSAAPNGKLRGFRIFPSTNREVFNASGLHAGELVVAVNGASVEDQDRKTGQEIFDSMKTASHATVTVVDRTGARRDVTIDPEDLAPEDQ